MLTCEKRNGARKEQINLLENGRRERVTLGYVTRCDFTCLLSIERAEKCTFFINFRKGAAGVILLTWRKPCHALVENHLESLDQILEKNTLLYKLDDCV